jgi:hypothetical protein
VFGYIAPPNIQHFRSDARGSLKIYFILLNVFSAEKVKVKVMGKS